MKIYEVTCYVEIPTDATDKEIYEWISFCFHRTASLADANPLSNHEPTIQWEPFDCQHFANSGT